MPNPSVAILKSLDVRAPATEATLAKDKYTMHLLLSLRYLPVNTSQEQCGMMNPRQKITIFTPDSMIKPLSSSIVV